MGSDEQSDWLTTSEAGRLLNYSSRHVTNLIRSGKLDGKLSPGGTWRIPQSEIYRLRAPSFEPDSLLEVAKPHAGWWDHLGRPNAALFITMDVRAVAQIEPDCRASLCIDTDDNWFPLHWAGHPHAITESDPDYITITPDISARVDVLFIPRTHRSAATLIPIASGRDLIVDKGDEESQGTAELVDWDGRGCWIARPDSLSQPRRDQTAFLRPGKYRIRIRIYHQGDILAYEGVYILNSPERREDLALDGPLTPAEPS